MTNTARLSRPFQILTWSLAIAVASFVIAVASIVIANGEQIKGFAVFESILISAFLISGLVFYVSLGMLAKRLGRSWIVWIGLTFITKPIGPFVAYFRMRRLVHNKLAPINRNKVDDDEIVELTDVVVVGSHSSHSANVEIKTASHISYLKYILAIAVVIFLTVALIVLSRPPANIPAASPVNPATTFSWPDIIKKAKRSVVTINTPTSSGSGFLASSDGLIITNTHVVSNNDTVDVTFYNGEKKLALVTKYGTPPLDIALLRVGGSNHEWLESSEPTDCEQGTEIITIGSPQGFNDSITKGIISNCDRDISGVNYIQTDTAINPGNSGGPVINKDGKIIGISTLKYAGSEGLNFLISSATIKAFIKGELEGLDAKLAALEEDRVRREQFAKEQTETAALYIYDQLWNALLTEDRQYFDRMINLVNASYITTETALNNIEIKRIPPTGFTSLSDWIVSLAVRILKKELTYEEAVKLIKGHYA